MRESRCLVSVQCVCSGRVEMAEFSVGVLFLMLLKDSTGTAV